MVWNLGLIQNTEIQNVVHSIAEFVYYMLYYYSASSIYINKEGRHSGDWKLELFFIIVQWKQCATTHIILQAYHLLLYIKIAGSAHIAQIYAMHGICWTGGERVGGVGEFEWKAAKMEWITNVDGHATISKCVIITKRSPL